MTNEAELISSTSVNTLDTVNVMGDYFTSPAALGLLCHVSKMSKSQTASDHGLSIYRNPRIGTNQPAGHCQERLDTLLDDITQILDYQGSPTVSSTSGYSRNSSDSSHTLGSRASSELELPSPLIQSYAAPILDDQVKPLTTSGSVLATSTNPPTVTLKSILKKPKSFNVEKHQQAIWQPPSAETLYNVTPTIYYNKDNMLHRSASIHRSPSQGRHQTNPVAATATTNKITSATEQHQQQKYEPAVLPKRSFTTGRIGSHIRSQIQESIALTTSISRAYSQYGSVKNEKREQPMPTVFIPPPPPTHPPPSPPLASPYESPIFEQEETPLIESRYMELHSRKTYPKHMVQPRNTSLKSATSFESFQPSQRTLSSTPSQTGPIGTQFGMVKCFQHPAPTLFNKIFPSKRPVFQEYMLSATPEGLLLLYPTKGLYMKDFVQGVVGGPNPDKSLLHSVAVAIMKLGGEVSVLNEPGGTCVLNVEGKCVKRTGIWIKGERMKWSLWFDNVEDMVRWENVIKSNICNMAGNMV
ncbi:UNVERIFIED_CONTAM: hypothetical protein HDU68_000369 [Siphonaria sp. JEL0065]|nr:hypothetical protein HDU68_000369 [Siphonaria sp. JEL0065]